MRGRAVAQVRPERILKHALILGLGLTEGVPQSLPPVRPLVLPNQLVVLVSEEPSLPVVTLHMLVDAGSWRDPRGEEGIAYLTAQGLLLGTSKHPVAALQEELDFMGASLNVSVQRDYSTLTLQILHKDLAKGVELFLEILTQPTFPEAEVRKEVEQTLASFDPPRSSHKKWPRRRSGKPSFSPNHMATLWKGPRLHCLS
jgi:predicted Zn-dependent peptidase